MAYNISVYLSTLLVLYTLSQPPLVYGKVTPWCGMIDYALVGRNYTTINAIKNQKLCHQACLKDSLCKSANYRPKEKECDLNCASHFDVCVSGSLVKKPGSLYTFTASKKNVCDIANNAPACPENQGLEWQLVFKGVARTGIKLHDLWTNMTWDGDLGCHGNYRNETLHNAWNIGQLNIKQVKLSLYDHTGVKVEVVFNGVDSDISSWFAKEHLLSSPWSDLTTDATTNRFSITGEVKYGDWHHARRFYINRSYDRCPGDDGWLVVLDSEGSCQWEQLPLNSYPVIMYSPHNKAVKWDTSNGGMLGKADYLTIHIDTE